jgi:hypothetical protein
MGRMGRMWKLQVDGCLLAGKDVILGVRCFMF